MSRGWKGIVGPVEHDFDNLGIPYSVRAEEMIEGRKGIKPGVKAKLTDSCREPMFLVKDTLLLTTNITFSF